MRRNWVAAMAVLAAMAAVAVSPAVAQTPDDRLVRMVDHEPKQVGALRLGSDLRLARALKAYGKPTRKRQRRGSSVCNVRWQRPGITVLGVSFDTPSRRRCDSRHLKIQQITVSGAGWTTDRGLAIGDSFERMMELYDSPNDEAEKGLFVLEFSDDEVLGPTPRLMAKVSKARVIRFQIWVGGAGD